MHIVILKHILTILVHIIVSADRQCSLISFTLIILEEALTLSNELDYGQVLINDVPTLRFDHMPYNGRRNSGYGTEGIKYAIKEMSQLKMVSLKYE